MFSLSLSLSLSPESRFSYLERARTSSSFSLRYPEPFIFTRYWERSASVCRPIPSFRKIFFQYRGESLSGSRQQQQVVNPFFKGSATGSVWGREGKEKLLRENLFVFFALSLAGVLPSSLAPRPSRVVFLPENTPPSRLDTSQPTFARFPITPFPFPSHSPPRERGSLNDCYTRGKRISCHWKFVVRVSTRLLPSNSYNGFRNKFTRFSSGVLVRDSILSLSLLILYRNRTAMIVKRMFCFLCFGN